LRDSRRGVVATLAGTRGALFCDLSRGSRLLLVDLALVRCVRLLRGGTRGCDHPTSGVALSKTCFSSRATVSMAWTEMPACPSEQERRSRPGIVLLGRHEGARCGQRVALPWRLSRPARLA
jgi:hypothetical protein